MTKPTIINAQSTDYAATSNVGVDRTFEDVVIPAEANTVIILAALTLAESARTLTDLTFGNASAIRTHLIDVSADTFVRATIAGVFDVSAAGAMTADVVATLDSSATGGARCGVICSTGFVESFVTTNHRSATDCESITFSPNYAENIFTMIGSCDVDISDFTVTEGTLIFKGAQSDAHVGVYGVVQDTEINKNQKKIGYTQTIEEHADLFVTLSSQKNPFATSSGPAIKPIISHDVIS